MALLLLYPLRTTNGSETAAEGGDDLLLDQSAGIPLQAAISRRALDSLGTSLLRDYRQVLREGDKTFVFETHVALRRKCLDDWGGFGPGANRIDRLSVSAN